MPENSRSQHGRGLYFSSKSREYVRNEPDEVGVLSFTGTVPEEENFPGQ